MTPRDRLALGRYVRRVADLMGLRDWTLNIEQEPCDDENCAMCAPTYGQKRASLSFAPHFRHDDSAESQRQTIVHELLHCVFAAEQDHIRLSLLKHLGQSTYDVFNDAYRQMHEYAIDGLADAIAPHMPLIKWPT